MTVVELADPAASRELEPATVEVWVLPATRMPPGAGIEVGLPDSERARAGRLRTDASRRLYLASRWLLWSAVAAYTGLGPGRAEVGRRCEHCGDPDHGRPRLTVRAGEPPIELSLSRATGLVALAASRVSVGVDVESAAGGWEPAAVAKVLSADERAALGASPDASRLMQAWVAKEALGKARGSGVVGVHSLSVAPLPAGVWRSVADGRRTWQVRLLDVGAGWAGAVATAAPGPAHVRLLEVA